MAVRIDIPEFGTVVAENAATESTLMELVRLLASAEGRRQNFDRSASQTLNATADAAAKTQAAMGGVASTTASVSQRTTDWYQNTVRGLEDIATANQTVYSAVTSLKQGLGTLALTVASATTAYATNYKELSTNPVGVAAATLGTGIDLATSALSGGIRAVSKGLGSLVSWIPFVGKGLGSLVKGLGEATSVAVQFAGTIAGKLNEVFATELQQTIDNFRTLTSTGAVFANGMMEMRITANAAGLTIDQFTAGVKSADQSIRAIGLSFTGGAQLVAETNQQFRLITENGISLRTQLLNMGYSFEEQVEVAADYIASVRAGTTNERLRSMTTAELARGTRAYAEDLRVLQALTKEDAKQAQENARLASMQADIMAQLDPESAQRFQGVLRSMPAELQKGFLEQLSLGTVVDAATNVYMSQNQAVGEMFNQMEGIIRNSNMTMGEAQDAMLRGRAVIADEQRRLARSGDVAISQAARVGVGGVAGAVADMINSIISGTLNDPEMVNETREAIKFQSDARDELTKSTNAMIDASQSFATEMEGKVLNYLPLYSALLKDTNDAMLGFMNTVLGFAGVRELNYETETVTGTTSYESFKAGLRDMLLGIFNKPKSGGRDLDGEIYTEGRPGESTNTLSGSTDLSARLDDRMDRQVLIASNSSKPTYGAGYDPQAVVTAQAKTNETISKLVNEIALLKEQKETPLTLDEADQTLLKEIAKNTSDTVIAMGRISRAFT